MEWALAAAELDLDGCPWERDDSLELYAAERGFSAEQPKPKPKETAGERRERRRHREVVSLLTEIRDALRER